MCKNLLLRNPDLGCKEITWPLRLPPLQDQEEVTALSDLYDVLKVEYERALASPAMRLLDECLDILGDDPYVLGAKDRAEQVIQRLRTAFTGGQWHARLVAARSWLIFSFCDQMEVCLNIYCYRCYVMNVLNPHAATRCFLLAGSEFVAKQFQACWPGHRSRIVGCDFAWYATVAHTFTKAKANLAVCLQAQMPT